MRRKRRCRGCIRRVTVGALGYCAACRHLAPTTEVMAAAIAQRNAIGKA
jgi:hypothetical protein